MMTESVAASWRVAVEADKSWMKLQNLKKTVRDSVGLTLIYTFKEGRSKVSQLWDIEQVYDRFAILRRECYAPDGSFRQVMRTSIHIGALYCGEVGADIIPEGV